jgi:NAD(P)-dependent dehydrogenase (short-subunit alcohol dehydrogenase family)
MLLENKTAVIYGAGGAIGGAVAGPFAREGARVFLAGRARASLGTVAETIAATGGLPDAHGGPDPAPTAADAGRGGERGGLRGVRSGQRHDRDGSQFERRQHRRLAGRSRDRDENAQRQDRTCSRAGRGLGRVIARPFSSLAASVVAVARDAERLNRLAAASPPFRPDVADAPAPAVAVALIGRHRPDVLALVAGAMPRFLADYTDLKSKRAGLGISVTAVLQLLTPATGFWAPRAAAHAARPGLTVEQFRSQLGQARYPSLGRGCLRRRGDARRDHALAGLHPVRRQPRAVSVMVERATRRRSAPGDWASIAEWGLAP